MLKLTHFSESKLFSSFVSFVYINKTSTTLDPWLFPVACGWCERKHRLAAHPNLLPPSSAKRQLGSLAFWVFPSKDGKFLRFYTTKTKQKNTWHENILCLSSADQPTSLWKPQSPPLIRPPCRLRSNVDSWDEWPQTNAWKIWKIQPPRLFWNLNVM